jgi:hypothetical protein
MKWTALGYGAPSAVGSDPTQAERRSFLLGTIVYGLLAIIWGSIYLAIGLTIPAMIPYGYVGFATLVLVFYRVTDRFAISRTAILLAWLVLPLLLQISLGGFNSGSAAVLWALQLRSVPSSSPPANQWPGREGSSRRSWLAGWRSPGWSQFQE